MIVRFDSLDRFEVPNITLCNPGSRYKDGCVTKVVGMLRNTEAEEGVFNFNSTSEFNFRINRVHFEDESDNAFAYDLYKAVQNKRLLFVEDIGYFVISDVEDCTQGGIQYKDVRAESIEVELQSKTVPFIEDGTYRFLSSTIDNSSIGILNIIMSAFPHWRIGHVDSSIAGKYRTFEDVDVTLNCLGFLLDDLQNAYECIVLFDIVNRVVNVYDQNTYVRHTDIHITKSDVVNSLSITENGDDIYTAINVKGGENITVAAINPTGTNVLYDFSNYISWMTESLGKKAIGWQTAIKNSQEGYYQTNLLYYSRLEERSNLEMEIEKLNTQITMYSRCRDNIVAESGTTLVGDYNVVIIEVGGTPIQTYEEIADTLAEIDRLILACEERKVSLQNTLLELNSAISVLLEEIERVHHKLSFDSYFTEEEQEELSNYIFEGSYTDDYVVITDIMTQEEKFEQMKILYDRASTQLQKSSVPTQEFSVDVESFVFEKDFAHWTSQLETGCLIQVEVADNDIASLFLTNISINYDDHKMTTTYGNRFNKYDVKSLFENTLGEISKSANSISYLKDVVSPIKNGEMEYVKDALQSVRDLSMASALSSESEEIVIDGSGFTGKKRLGEGKYDPKQIKITSRTIVFTDDSWQSCRTAVGEVYFGNGESAYGINAEAVIGDFIVGHNLRIIDDEGNDIFTVVDGKIAASIQDVDGRVSNLEQDANNVNIRIDALEQSEVQIDSITTSTGYTFDENGLSICKDGEEIQNILDNTGMYVTREDEEILSANGDGVSSINMVARDYLVVGSNSRFEDYIGSDGSRRTACFYIGQ